MYFKRTLLAAALPLMFTFTGAAQALQLKFADIHPAGYPTVVAEENMGKTLTKETNGELTFQYFPGGVLGSEKEVIEQMQVGAVQLSRVSLGIVGPVVPDVNVFNMPFIFRDHQHMRNVIDGAVGDEILDKITNSEFGLVALAWMDGGTRNIYTKKPVRKLEDLKGMKIRVQGNPMFIDMMNAMGGNGIAMDTGEIFSALQTGVIDGAENNPPTLLEHNHFRVAMEESLKLFDGVWLPLPFLRFMAPHRFDEGPNNWSRMRLVKLAEPDLDGNTHRLTLAFDTRIMAAVAALVAACGGGENAPITSVKVMGDSLADSGTFGLKFTVQGTSPTGAPTFRTTLVVRFDEDQVNGLAGALGLPVWPQPRPKPVVWLAINDGSGPRLVGLPQSNAARPMDQRPGTTRRRRRAAARNGAGDHHPDSADCRGGAGRGLAADRGRACAGFGRLCQYPAGDQVDGAVGSRWRGSFGQHRRADRGPLCRIAAFQRHRRWHVS